MKKIARPKIEHYFTPPYYHG
eukprot:SAG11_NODE_28825_length_317_cov_1.183486_1_plen_20_part_10